MTETIRAESERAFALGHSVAEWAMPTGADMLGRTEPLRAWLDARRANGMLPVFRSIEDGPGVFATTRLDDGRTYRGMNFGSQDYLGLVADPRVTEAAIRAIRAHGMHSASSGALQGGTPLARALEEEIGDFVGAEHVVLFPTGFGAGFGTITALVRPHDHVVLDALAHASLQQGAHAATQQVHRHRHLDVDGCAQTVADVRRGDGSAGILVVTEGTFSMDADAPDLRRLQAICREHDAILMVDVAHDLGELGPGGTGQLGLQGMLGEVDLVMGAFSKVFCSCGGFLATSSRAVKDFVRMFGGSFMFSNALSAPQAAAALESMRIARSSEGDELRAEVQRAARTLRGAFAERGLDCYGHPCAIVAVPVGDEQTVRIASSLLRQRGVIANLIEFPAVGLGKARFRMQLMPGHTDEILLEAAAIVADTIEEARALARTAEVDR